MYISSQNIKKIWIQFNNNKINNLQKTISKIKSKNIKQTIISNDMNY